MCYNNSQITPLPPPLRKLSEHSVVATETIRHRAPQSWNSIQKGSASKPDMWKWSGGVVQ